MKTKEIFSYVFSALMLVCMLFVVAIMVRWEFFSPSRDKQQRPTRQVQHWRQLPLQGQRSGPKDAPVQIVGFFDYQCPFCKATQPAVKAVRQKYPKKVAVIHEDFPLQMHLNAYGAAIAAECARRQHDFMAYHDSLFANQNRLGKLSYTKLAGRIGVPDTAAFHTCVASKKTAGIVKSGQALADTLNIHGIPTFIINGTLISGTLSRQRLNGLVQDALAKAGK